MTDPTDTSELEKLRAKISSIVLGEDEDGAPVGLEDREIDQIMSLLTTALTEREKEAERRGEIKGLTYAGLECKETNAIKSHLYDVEMFTDHISHNKIMERIKQLQSPSTHKESKE